MYHVLLGERKIADVRVVSPTGGFDLVPANRELAGAEVELVDLPEREMRLEGRARRSAAADALGDLSEVAPDYDFILLDCPPSLSLLTLNGLCAADSVLIPMQCEYYALEGLSDLVQTVKKVRAHLNPRLEIEGLLRTMYDPRNTLALNVAAELEKHFGDKLYRTVIPRNIRLAEAPSHGIPVLHLDRTSKGAQAYLALAGEMLRRMEAATAEGAGAPAADVMPAGAQQRSRNDDSTQGARPRPRRAARGRRQRGDERCAAGDRDRSSAARQVPAAHADGRRRARRSRGIDSRARRDAADPGAADRRRRGSRSSPASAAGARRRRAGLAEVPALVKAVPDQSALALALIENIQREDLNPLEQANGIHRLIEEFGLTHEAAAKAVGRSRSAVTNLLRLRELAKPVQAYLLDGQIDMGHARALLALSAGQQTAAAARVVAQGLSVRETERLVHQFAHPGRRDAKRGAVAPDPDLARLQEELADALGATVSIVPKANGAGKVVIGYSSLEQLDGILAKLR